MGVLTDAATYANDPDLLPPLTAAIVAAAVAISSESNDTPGHVQRVQLATQVLNSPAAMSTVFAWATSINGTVVGKWVSGDHDGALGDIPFVLGTVWDAVAGVG